MRQAISLLAAIGAALLLTGGVLFLVPVLGKPSVATAQTSSTEDSWPGALRGVFSVQWEDPGPGSNVEPKTTYSLVDNQGGEKELLLDQGDAIAVGGPLALSGKRVKVMGVRVPNGTERVDVQRIDIEDPREAAKARAKTAAGEPTVQTFESGTSSKPWVTIGCRPKSSTATLKPRSYFEGLLGVTYPAGATQGVMADKEPGIDHYWKELSFNNINLDGSQVGDGLKTGTKFWYDLPGSKKNYTWGGSLYTQKILDDCTYAARADVNFQDFYGINLMISDFIGNAAYGSSSKDLRWDGSDKKYAVTWVPPFEGHGHDWVTHEMGHGFGMPHSSGPYSATYDSEWDVMSGAGMCETPDSTYFGTGVHCVADHTISFHKDLVGWIPSERKYTATPGPNEPIDIERLGDPSATGNCGSNTAGPCLIAQIPIGDSTTKFYTVEARRFGGDNAENLSYDGHENGKIPGEAIVIHKVDKGLTSRNAKVVDPDNNGNPNDAGAMWLPGEKFTADGITVEVTNEPTQSGSGYKVRITR